MKGGHVVRQRRRQASLTPHQPPQPKDAPLDLTRQVYLAPDEAVRYLRLKSLAALRGLLHRGEIPAWCYTHVGRQLRFLRTALDEHFQAQARDARQLVAKIHHQEAR